MRRKITKVFLSILALIVIFIVAVAVFMNTAPQFGKLPEGADLDRIKKSSHYNGVIFENNHPTSLSWPMRKMIRMTWEFMKGGDNAEPSMELPQKDFNANDLEIRNDTNMRIRWFGHSAFYVEIDGKRLLLDPMLGPIASPISFIGSKRFNEKLPIEIEEIPYIDAVLYSHDHYDHLDYPSVLGLKDKVGHWYVPLGLGSHLKSWGVEEEKITEMDWWEETEFMNLKFACTPARHFSGRKFSSQSKTLWASWVIEGENQKLYFSGDGGYFKGFKEIGDKYGPFDLCLIECGAYNKAWHDIHMMPEESAQAAVDLKGRLMMPIHWGAFNLALHSWDDPIVRVSKKAKELNMPMLTPIIGEEVIIPKYVPNESWWENL